jgi:hypothetical protein
MKTQGSNLNTIDVFNSPELSFAYEHVIANRDFKMNKAKIRHDRAVRPSKFKIGDLVWLSIEATKVGVAKKLSHSRLKRCFLRRADLEESLDTTQTSISSPPTEIRT